MARWLFIRRKIGNGLREAMLREIGSSSRQHRSLNTNSRSESRSNRSINRMNKLNNRMNRYSNMNNNSRFNNKSRNRV